MYCFHSVVVANDFVVQPHCSKHLTTRMSEAASSVLVLIGGGTGNGVTGECMCLYSKNIEVVIKNATTRTPSHAIYTLCLSYEYSYPLHGYVTYTGMVRNVLYALPP